MTTDNRKAQLGVEVDSTGAKQGFEEVKQGARDMAQTVARSGQEAAKGLDAVGTGGAQAAQKVAQSANSIADAIKRSGGAATEAAKSWGDLLKERMGPAMREFAEQGLPRAEAHAAAIRKIAEEWRAYKASAAAALQDTKKTADETSRTYSGLSASQSRFLEGLKRQATVATEGRAAWLQLRAAQEGVTSQAQPFIEKLRQAEASLSKTGVSAAQTAAAMRSIPAQMTDIVTQLAGGQNPLLILTQQGGQLKDQFGGVGAAARGMGAYIVGLITPFSVLGAAAAVLALAYKQGAAESDAYVKALVLTGNAAGVTATQLQANAKAISASVGTQGAAAEALTALVNTGAVSAQNLQSAGLVAVKIQRELGISVGETAKQFAELSKTPLEASIKLNEQYHFLTLKTYEQIKALQEQGRTADAATLAQETFAQAMNGRMNQLTSQLGYVERAARGVTDAAKSMWDALLDVGRRQTTGQAADAVAKRIALVQSQIAATNASVNESPNNSKSQRLQGELKVLQDQLTVLGRRALLEDNVATSAGAAAAAVEARVSWDKDGVRFANKTVELQREINKARNDGIAAGKTEKEIQERIAAIKEKFADKGAASAARSAAKDQRDAEIEAIKGVERQRVEAAKQAQDQIRVLRATGELDERQAIEENTRLDVAALTAKKSSLEDQLALMSKQKSSHTEIARVQREAAEVDAQIKGRMLKGENDLIIAIHQREEAWAKATQAENASFVEKQQDRAAQLQAEVKAQLEANAAIGLTGAALASLEVAKLSEAAATKDRLAVEAEENFLSREVIQAYRDQAQALRDLAAAKQQGAILQANADTAKKAQEEWQRTSDQIGQALANSLMEGGKSAGEYIKGLFRTMVLQPVIKAIVQPIAGTAAALLGGLSGTASAAGGSGTGSAISGISGISSLYNAYTGASIAGLGSAISGVGSLFGSSSISAYGAGIGLTSSQAAAAAAAYNAAGMTATGSAISAGAATGGALSSVASAIPYVAAVVAVLNLLGAFRSKKVVGNGLVGTVGDGGDLDVFSLIRRGGTLFSGPSYSIQTADADPKLVQGIKTAVEGMLAAARAQAGVIGAGGNLASFSAPLGSELIHPEVGRMGITLTGLTDEQARAKIEAEVTKLAENMASQALGPAGEALAKAGETASQTLQRLSGSLSAVNTALGAFNDNLLAANLAGADAASKLADMFGGIDQFTQSTQAYYQRFFSDAERAANATKQLGQAFTDLGLGALPASKQAYRELVNAQDLTTESGRKTYASLLSLSSVFADLKDAVEQASQGVQAEIQRLRGTAGTQSLASLQADFAVKTAQARSGDSAALSALPEISKALEKARTATATSAADVAFVRASLAASLSETLRALKVPGFADGGLHAGGWRVVGERGPELEWTPASRIYSNPQSQQLLNTERLEAQIAALTAEVKELRQQQLAADTQQIFYTKRTTDLVTAVVNGSQSFATRDED